MGYLFWREKRGIGAGNSGENKWVLCKDH